MMEPESLFIIIVSQHIVQKTLGEMIGDYFIKSIFRSYIIDHFPTFTQ